VYLDRPFARIHAYRFIFNVLEAPGKSVDLAMQNVMHVVAVTSSRQKVAAFGFGTVVGSGPAEEVIRIVRKSAHIAGRNVQQMAGTSGSIGCAATKTAIALDENDGSSAGRFTQELGCENRPGKSTADNGEGAGGLVRTGRG
jgi:hypothetical protein